jgi:hypothetical protein
MKLLISGCLLLSLVLLHGCSNVSDAGYYWGGYATTLYTYQKDPSPETLAQHESELREIVEYSNTNDLSVPPGIFAELGYIQQKRGDSDAALIFYEQEMVAYPESRLFLERLSSGLIADSEEGS